MRAGRGRRVLRDPALLTFVGRFPPLVVHLPIGVMMLGFVLEGRWLESGRELARS